MNNFNKITFTYKSKYTFKHVFHISSTKLFSKFLFLDEVDDRLDAFLDETQQTREKKKPRSIEYEPIESRRNDDVNYEEEGLYRSINLALKDRIAASEKPLGSSNESHQVATGVRLAKE